MKIVKWLFISITTITIVFVIVAYIALRASLPTLDGDISTSEIKVSVVLEEKYMELAVRALHTAFELDSQAEV
jgi:hypothetical protein